MTRPVKYPIWATDGGADVVEPSGGRKTAGWSNSERPIPEYFNWWQELVYDWLLHLDAGDQVDFYGPAEGFTEFALPAIFEVGTNAWQGDLSDDLSVIFPIVVPVGRRIKAITVYGRAGTAGETFAAIIVEKSMTAGTSTQISTTKTSSAANGATTIGWTTADTDITPSGLVVATAKSYQINVVLQNADNVGDVEIWGVSVTHDRLAL